jgi:hypothetical protein
MELIAPLVDIVGGRAIIDTSHLDKQPDWTYAPKDSGAMPAARFGNTPLTIRPPKVREVAMPQLVSSVDDPPLAQVRAAHRRMETTLERLRGTTDEAELRSLLERLARQLRLHVDVTTRVLYPTVARAVPDDGDEVSWSAEHHADACVRHVERLLGSGGRPDGDDLARIEADLQDHVADEERQLIPLLHERLDRSELELLGRAMASARLDSSVAL